MTPPPQPIQSAANPQFKALRQLAQDNTAWRTQGRIWLEGDHLCRAALARGWRPALAVWAASHWMHAQAQVQVQRQTQKQPQTQAQATPTPPAIALDAAAADPATHLPALARAAARHLVLDDALMARLSALPSPAPLAFVLDLPPAPALLPDAPTVVLDRVQDAGNVGSILRSAAAFGFTQVLALAGAAALWSPKVLRAGMGAHFGLRLIDGLAASDIARLRVPLLVTSSHQGDWLHRARLPWPCAWVMGHEGQGIAPALMQQASQRLRIAQPGGEESLNVAAAAAICLHASAATAELTTPGS